MRNVQMHKVLPVGLTYSSTHTHRVYGEVGVVGGIHSWSQSLIWGSACMCEEWYGQWGVALFQARVTRALSALWGWGPVAMDTGKSTDRNMYSRVKSGRGQDRGEAQELLRLAYHVMARRRPVSLFTFKMDQHSTRLSSAAWVRRIGLHSRLCMRLHTHTCGFTS